VASGTWQPVAGNRPKAWRSAAKPHERPSRIPRRNQLGDSRASPRGARSSIMGPRSSRWQRTKQELMAPLPPDIGSASTGVLRRSIFLKNRDFALRHISVDKLGKPSHQPDHKASREPQLPAQCASWRPHPPERTLREPSRSAELEYWKLRGRVPRLNECQMDYPRAGVIFSLRRLRRVGCCARCGRLSVHCVHPDRGHDVAGHTWGTPPHRQAEPHEPR
jgi:hypothetical protein